MNRREKIKSLQALLNGRLSLKDIVPDVVRPDPEKLNSLERELIHVMYCYCVYGEREFTKNELDCIEYYSIQTDNRKSEAEGNNEVVKGWSLNLKYPLQKYGGIDWSNVPRRKA